MMTKNTVLYFWFRRGFFGAREGDSIDLHKTLMITVVININCLLRWQQCCQWPWSLSRSGPVNEKKCKIKKCVLFFFYNLNSLFDIWSLKKYFVDLVLCYASQLMICFVKKTRQIKGQCGQLKALDVQDPAIIKEIKGMMPTSRKSRKQKHLEHYTGHSVQLKSNRIFFEVNIYYNNWMKL